VAHVQLFSNVWRCKIYERFRRCDIRLCGGVLRRGVLVHVWREEVRGGVFHSRIERQNFS
jgi:hypothetical protein